MDKELKVGFISPVDPFSNRKGWSGTYYSTRVALENIGCKVTWISYKNEGFLLKISSFLYKLLYGRGSTNHFRLNSFLKARTIDKNLDDFDFIFVPGQSEVIAGLKTSTPIIYYTDATVPLMNNYYWFGYSNRGIREAIKVEKKASHKTLLNIYASSWAKESAIKEYGISENRAIVLPFGAGLDKSDLASERVLTTKEKRKNSINIIFSGVDWKRKGGDIAVKTVEKLNRDGYKAKLYICGIKNLDINIKKEPYVSYIGFLNKEIPEQYKKYVETYRNSDILLLPTRAECAGIVFNEASAFGIPSLTTNTGGIADYVKNGINGERLPLGANYEEYAKKIEEWIDNDYLGLLSKGARKVYEETNSWEAWGKTFEGLINKMERGEF